EVLEDIDFVTKAANQLEGERPVGPVKAMIAAIPAALEVSTRLLGAWDQHGLAIKAHLGCSRLALEAIDTPQNVGDVRFDVPFRMAGAWLHPFASSLPPWSTWQVRTRDCSSSQKPGLQTPHTPPSS